MNKRSGYVFVWPIGTRIIHWMMALSFSAAFFTSFYEPMLHDHVAFGFIFLTIIIYRIIWGLVGPEYARFKTFKLKPSQLKEYFVVKVTNRWRKIPAGHNPASSWFTIWALGVGFVIVVSGLLFYGIQEGKGLFRNLNDDSLKTYALGLKCNAQGDYQPQSFDNRLLAPLDKTENDLFWRRF